MTMPVEFTEWSARPGTIDDLWVVDVKQVVDERGAIRELFRRSDWAAIGLDLAPFRQVNATTSRRGVVRGMHAEAMTKLVTVASGEALGAYLDLRPESATFGTAEAHPLAPGRQVLVPPGVANGFQSITDECVYVYCFDDEWSPTMAGRATTPLDGHLPFDWPIPVDPDDTGQISRKDRAAPTFAELRAALS